MNNKRLLLPLLWSSLWCVLNFGHASAVEHDSGQKAAPSTHLRPNIIFILTDDLDARELAAMQRVQLDLVYEGVSYTNYFVTNSLCCPSRASILRGQYVHNHGIWQNNLPSGGFGKFHGHGLENSTIATWLQAGGYRTALMGKYLNTYPRGVQPTYVPPGWDVWDSPTDRNAYSEFNYKLNENGKIIPYGDGVNDYLTDVLSRKAGAFIRQSAESGTPFFLYLATYAPHSPWTPAPRHRQTFADAQAPRTASFNEKDVSSKPAFIRALQPMSARMIARVDKIYRLRLQTLQAVDELVAHLVEVLRQTGQLDKTYIVFTSDNGFHLGQHRLDQGKQTAYEEDIHVPLIMRGPGIPAGHVVPDLAVEVDLAPTFAAWAGVPTPVYVDGRVLTPLLKSKLTVSHQSREGVLIEHRPGNEPFLSRFERKIVTKGRLPAYTAVRSRNYLYVEYETGERELYDVRNDIDELNNIYRTAAPALLKRLSEWLQRMKTCATAGCRLAEEMPTLEASPRATTNHVSSNQTKSARVPG